MEAESEPLLRRAAVSATRAPSVGNTQPWEFVLGPDYLEVHAVRERRLPSDPSGRQLLISCGCAVFNARVALAAGGTSVIVDRDRDPRRPTRVAQLRLADTNANAGSGTALAALAESVSDRRTNRQPFAATAVPDQLIDQLCAAAAEEGGTLLRAGRGPDGTALTGVLDQLITTPAPEKTSATLPSPAVPSPGAAQSANGSLLLLACRQDTDLAWLRAGEALQRAWLAATASGIAVGVVSQSLEAGTNRDRVRALLGDGLFPLLLLELGYAAPTPATRRRRLVEVLRTVH